MVTSDLTEFRLKMENLSTPRGIMSAYKCILNYYENADRRLYLREDQKALLFQTFKKKYQVNIEKKAKEIKSQMEETFSLEIKEKNNMLKRRKNKINELKKHITKLNEDLKETSRSKINTSNQEYLIESLKMQIDNMNKTISLNHIQMENSNKNIIGLQEELKNEQEETKKLKEKLENEKEFISELKISLKDKRQKHKNEKYTWQKEKKDMEDEYRKERERILRDSQMNIEQIKREKNEIEEKLKETQESVKLEREDSNSGQIEYLKNVAHKTMQKNKELKSQIKKLKYSNSGEALKDENEMLKLTLEDMKSDYDNLLKSKTLLEDSRKNRISFETKDFMNSQREDLNKNMIIIDSSKGISQSLISTPSRDDKEDFSKIKMENENLKMILKNKEMEIAKARNLVKIQKPKDVKFDLELGEENQEIKQKLKEGVEAATEMIQKLLEAKVNNIEEKFSKITDLKEPLEAKFMTIMSMKKELKELREWQELVQQKSMKNYEGKGRDYYKKKKKNQIWHGGKGKYHGGRGGGRGRGRHSGRKKEEGGMFKKMLGKMGFQKHKERDFQDYDEGYY